MADIDQEFKSSGRPTSMMAQRFSMLLDSSFGLDETTESVIKKKEEVASQAAELEELQARLAAMEEKLSVNKKVDNLSPTGNESSHSRSRSVSQKPYLRGPIALSVRPETPKTDKPELPAQKQTKLPARPAQQQAQQQPVSRFLSMRRKQRPQPEEEEEDDSEEEEDSDGSEEEDDDSETSSSEEPPRRK